jgi:hypothetical protein
MNILENLPGKNSILIKMTRITGTFPEDPCTFMITSPVLLKIQNVSEKGRGENQNTHFTFNNAFPKTRAIYEILWKNTVEPEATYDAIWRMRIACWKTTATNTHRIWNTYCSFMARVVTRTRLNVTFISSLPFPIRTSYYVVNNTPV